MTASVEIAVLGPLEVRVDGAVVTVGARSRALVAALALRAGSDVTADRLMELLWPDGGGSRNALQALVSRTRRALAPASRVLVTGSHGYRLDVADDALDAARLTAAVSRARRLDAVDIDTDSLAAVLASWRGDPYAEVADDPEAVAAATGLRERYLEGVELHAEAVLAHGGGAELAVDLRSFAAEHPTRERLHRALATALYLAGRQTDALEVLDALAARLRDELGLDPEPRTGELRTAVLRHDLDAIGPAIGRRAVVAVGQGRGSDHDATVSMPATPRSRPLPRPRTSFVGRASECAELADAIARERLVTLIGPGGSGKTRLAIEVLAGLPSPPRDGVVFVDLAPLQDPADVLPELAISIGLEPTTAGPASVRLPERTLVDRVRDRLRHAQLLVLVDNCEHVIDAAARAIEVALDSGPDVRVVATSREGLRLDGERLWSVPPLAVGDGGLVDDVARWRAGLPGGDEPVPADPQALLDHDAPRLFVERARAADPTFHLDATTAPAVAELCRRLDGLPLGIELAAARVGTVPVTTLAARLEDRFRLLTAGRRTVRRQETLSAVVAWSYDLLDEPQQRVLRRLGVFSGSVSLELAEMVLGDERGDLLPTLAALADRSLVLLTDDDRPGSGATGPGGSRVAMLETIRAYARERLLADDDAGAVRDRHARVMADRAAHASAELRGPDQIRWHMVLYDEVDEHRAAAAWLLGSDPVLAVRLSADLAWSAWLRDRHDEAARWLQRSLTAAGDAVPAELEAIARAWLAFLLSFANEQHPAKEHADAAVAALARAGGQVPAFVEVSVPLLAAYVEAFSIPDPTVIVPRLEHAVARAEELGEVWVVAAARYVLAVILTAAGERERARREHHLGIEAAASCDNVWAEFQHRQQLAIELVVDGDYSAAAEHADRAIPLGEAIGAHGQVRTARIHRAVVALHDDDLELARTIVDDVLGAGGVEAAGGAAGGYALTTLAHLRHREGDAAGAVAAARRAEAVYLEVDEGAGAVVACVATVLASIDLGDLAEARSALERAITYAQRLPVVVLGTGVAYLLEASAALLLAEQGAAGAVGAAARLGRAAALREGLGRPLVGSERREVDRLEAAVERTLGVQEAATAIAAGRDRTGLLPPLD